MTSKELMNERQGLWKSMKEMLEAAKADGEREFTAEEETRYAKLEEDLEAKGIEIEKVQKTEARSLRVAEIGEDLEGNVDDPILPEPGGDNRTVDPRATDEYRAAFRGYLQRGERLPAAEQRALQMDSDVAGGYTVAPQQFVAELIEAVKNLTVMRQLGRTFSVPKAESMGAPALDNRPADPTWTAEILTGDEDSTMSFGKRELFPHPLAQRIKLSKKLVRSSALSIEAVVRDQLSYKIAVVEETAFMTGSGSNQPLGVFTASDQGISTSRDVSTANTTTALKADNLIECKYTLLSNYWAQARWIFHRTVVKAIRLLKDGNGQYLWRPGLMGDRGDTILDIPIIMSEYAPNTMTSGLYVGILGDFSRYWIADALDMTIQVLVELYAETNQNGYVSRKETDAMPVLEEAFVRVTMA